MKAKCPMCGSNTVQVADERRRPAVGEGEICETHVQHWRDYQAVEFFCLNCPCRFVLLEGDDAPARCEACEREHDETRPLNFPIGGTI